MSHKTSYGVIATVGGFVMKKVTDTFPKNLKSYPPLPVKTDDRGLLH